jgi:hypothetical protein
MATRTENMSNFRRRVLKLAKNIASGKADFISPDCPGGPVITDKDYERLTEMGGEILFFDDECGIYPTDVTREQRVLFLCFAATA